MKKYLLMILLTILTASCGKSKVIDGKEYECYGFFDKDEVKQEHVNYKFVKMNLVPGILFSETIIAPILIFGFESHCPTGKVTNENNNSSTTNNK